MPLYMLQPAVVRSLTVAVLRQGPRVDACDSSAGPTCLLLAPINHHRNYGLSGALPSTPGPLRSCRDSLPGMQRPQDLFCSLCFRRLSGRRVKGFRLRVWRALEPQPCPGGRASPALQKEAPHDVGCFSRQRQCPWSGSARHSDGSSSGGETDRFPTSIFLYRFSCQVASRSGPYLIRRERKPYNRALRNSGS